MRFALQALSKHARFVARTVEVRDGNPELAMSSVNRILQQERIQSRVKGRRYFEKPSIKRERIANERDIGIFRRAFKKKMQLFDDSK
eukprot:m.82426 g.82426  ORF g.82426 m.82426 type:complete len:87 (+) comp16332_c0_seq1:188-448(+)